MFLAAVVESMENMGVMLNWGEQHGQRSRGPRLAGAFSEMTDHVVAGVPEGSHSLKARSRFIRFITLFTSVPNSSADVAEEPVGFRFMHKVKALSHLRLTATSDCTFSCIILLHYAHRCNDVINCCGRCDSLTRSPSLQGFSRGHWSTRTQRSPWTKGNVLTVFFTLLLPFMFISHWSLISLLFVFVFFFLSFYFFSFSTLRHLSQMGSQWIPGVWGLHIHANTVIHTVHTNYKETHSK